MVSHYLTRVWTCFLILSQFSQFSLYFSGSRSRKLEEGETKMAEVDPGLLLPNDNDENVIDMEDKKKSRRRLKEIKIEESLIELDPSLRFDQMIGVEKQVQKIHNNLEIHYMFPGLGGGPSKQSEFPRGIFLHGPPGTGKTLFAKTVAIELGIVAGKQFAFYYQNSPNIVSPWVEVTESSLRILFGKAKETQPSIIFLDNVDMILHPRSGSEWTAAWTLKGLIDSIVPGEIIVIAAARNRDYSNENSANRARREYRSDSFVDFFGNFEELKFDLPTPEERREMILKFMHPFEDLDDDLIDLIVDRTEGFSGLNVRTTCNSAKIRRWHKEHKNTPDFLTAHQQFDVTDFQANLLSHVSHDPRDICEQVL